MILIGDKVCERRINYNEKKFMWTLFLSALLVLGGCTEDKADPATNKEKIAVCYLIIYKN